MQIETKSLTYGIMIGSLLILLPLATAYTAWRLKPPVEVIIEKQLDTLVLSEKTRDAAVQMGKACLAKGKDMYWDAMNSASLRGEAIHIACPMKGKAARRFTKE